jgi:Mg/Co/Ni transporter MgtE
MKILIGIYIGVVLGMIIGAVFIGYKQASFLEKGSVLSITGKTYICVEK